MRFKCLAQLQIGDVDMADKRRHRDNYKYIYFGFREEREESLEHLSSEFMCAQSERGIVENRKMGKEKRRV